MATTLIPPEARPQAGGQGPGRNGTDSGGDGFGGERPESYGSTVREQVYRTGIWVALGAIVMLFATFTSALVVRKGLSSDWIPMPLPAVLWLNTLVLVSSSLTLERSRRSLAAGSDRMFARWWFVTTGLGLVFIAGQGIAWRELVSRGVYLGSNPSSSFFYLLTGTHALHLLGGICALLFVIHRSRGNFLSQTVVDVAAIYWHSMDALWIYVFVLLSAGGWF
jgi:cytochrome c oxidase subunit III